MGCEIITGKMGGGKSYLGVEIAFKAWDEGAIVHSNLAFKPDKVIQAGYAEQFIPLADDPLEWLNTIRPGAEGQENVVIIDEGAIIFNAQDFQKGKDQKQAIFQYMVHARKLGLDVWFISQHPKNIDAQIRRMSERMIQCLKTETVPPIGFILAKLRGKFVRYCCDNTGKTVFETNYVDMNQEWADSYHTDARHGKTTDVARDVRRVRKVNESVTRTKRRMAFAAAGVAALFIFSFGGIAKVFAKSTPAKPAGAVVSPATVLQPAPAVSEAPKSAFERRGMIWPDARGKLHIEFPSKEVAYIGGFFRDSIVKRIDRDGEIITIRLENGVVIRTRPTKPHERKPYTGPFPEDSKPNTPWNTKSQYSSPSSVPLSPGSLVRSLSQPQAKQ